MYSMESKNVMILVLVSSMILAPFLGQDILAKSGLKVNIETDKGSGNAEFCAHGGGDTICKNSSSSSVQLQFGEGVVGEGESVRGCVDFNGDVRCESTTNSDCKCPENIFISFGGNGREESSSSSSASSSSSSATSSSSIGDIIINNLRD